MVACYEHSGIGEGAKRTTRKKPAFFINYALLLTNWMPRTLYHVAVLSYLEQWNVE